MQLPDAEQLLIQLTESIRRDISPSTALVGIHTGGVWLAERLLQNLQLPLPFGTLDVSFYRDDFGQIGLHPQVKPSDIPFRWKAAISFWWTTCSIPGAPSARQSTNYSITADRQVSGWPP